MAIEKRDVPSEMPGVTRPEYRVEGDPNPWNAYPTEAEAKARQDELDNR